MVTLYIRDVPDDVSDILKERATADGRSLSAYVAAELAKIARRPTNAQIVTRLRSRDRSRGPGTDDILRAVQSGRR